MGYVMHEYIHFYSKISFVKENLQYFEIKSKKCIFKMMSSYWVLKAQVGSNTQCKLFFIFIKISILLQNIAIFSSQMKSLYRNGCIHVLYAPGHIHKVCVLVLYINKGVITPLFGQQSSGLRKVNTHYRNLYKIAFLVV